MVTYSLHKVVNTIIGKCLFISFMCLCSGSRSNIEADDLYTNQFIVKLNDLNADIFDSLKKFGLTLVHSLPNGLIRVKDESLPAVTSLNSPGMQGFIQKFKHRVETVEQVQYSSTTLHIQFEEMRSSRISPKFLSFSSRNNQNVYDISKVCVPYYGMGVEKAWLHGYTGKGVTVAVVDIGIDTAHVDLAKNIDLEKSYNFVGLNKDVKPQTLRNYPDNEVITNHGNEMAGLIAAEKGNEICSAGIAFNASIAALRVFELDERYGSGFRDATEAILKALNHKNDQIHIYSCSFNNKYRFRVLPSDIKDTLRIASTEGRLGKGSIIVFPSGDNKNAGRRNGVNDCNTDPYANSLYTMTFSSVGPGGTRPDYAIPCASTVASTYGWGHLYDSASLTTAYHRDSCTTVKGVSASTAMAAGIIALALEANPNLSQRDILHLIILTSSFDEINDKEPPSVNGVGLKYHQYFGFGLMNAGLLSKEARKWTNVGAQKTMAIKLHKSRLVELCKTLEQVYLAEINVSKCLPSSSCVRSLEHVMLSIKYSTSFESQMNLLLCSPMGTCSSILNASRASGRRERIVRQWSFTSLQFWGEYPLGGWKLYMIPKESAKRHSFEIKSLEIILFGTDHKVLVDISNETRNKTAGLDCYRDVKGEATMTSPSHIILALLVLGSSLCNIFKNC